MELNNIIKIETAKAKSIAPLFVQETLNQCSLDGNVEWEELGIKVPAKMIIENRVEDKDLLVFSEVTFRSCVKFSVKERLCLRLTLKNGRKILVGDGKRPHLGILYRAIHPDNVADSQLTEYTVSRLSKTGPLEILD